MLPMKNRSLRLLSLVCLVALLASMVPLTALGFILLAARFFRADTLLSAESLTLRRLRKELRIR